MADTPRPPDDDSASRFEDAAESVSEDVRRFRAEVEKARQERQAAAEWDEFVKKRGQTGDRPRAVPIPRRPAGLFEGLKSALGLPSAKDEDEHPLAPYRPARAVKPFTMPRPSSTVGVAAAIPKKAVPIPQPPASQSAYVPPPAPTPFPTPRPIPLSNPPPPLPPAPPPAGRRGYPLAAAPSPGPIPLGPPGPPPFGPGVFGFAGPPVPRPPYPFPPAAAPPRTPPPTPPGAGSHSPFSPPPGPAFAGGGAPGFGGVSPASVVREMLKSFADVTPVLRNFRSGLTGVSSLFSAFHGHAGMASRAAGGEDMSGPENRAYVWGLVRNRSVPESTRQRIRAGLHAAGAAGKAVASGRSAFRSAVHAGRQARAAQKGAYARYMASARSSGPSAQTVQFRQAWQTARRMAQAANATVHARGRAYAAAKAASQAAQGNLGSAVAGAAGGLSAGAAGAIPVAVVQGLVQGLGAVKDFIKGVRQESAYRTESAREGAPFSPAAITAGMKLALGDFSRTARMSSATGASAAMAIDQEGRSREAWAKFEQTAQKASNFFGVFAGRFGEKIGADLSGLAGRGERAGGRVFGNEENVEKMVKDMADNVYKVFKEGAKLLLSPALAVPGWFGFGPLAEPKAKEPPKPPDDFEGLINPWVRRMMAGDPAFALPKARLMREDPLAKMPRLPRRAGFP